MGLRWLVVALALAACGSRVQPPVQEAGAAPMQVADGAPAAPVALDAATFADGSCLAYAPTSGDRHLTVALDPGHGGPDPGTGGTTSDGTSVTEEALTLKVAQQALAQLRALGFRVVMTRTTDATVHRLKAGDLDGGLLTAQGEHADNVARALCANDGRASVLISIHLNSADSPSAAGSETVWSTGRSFSARSERLATLLQQHLLSALDAHGWEIPDDGVVDDTRVGTAVTDADSAYAHLVVLGPGQAGYLDHPSAMPGALVEPLFLTDPFEASVAASGVGQQAMATGITQAVLAFLA